MILISILILIFLFVLLIMMTITWSVHISMVKEDYCPYGWATYSKFKREFNKYNWEWDKTFKNSLFNYSEGGYLHASIYKFDNKGMIMSDPISYLLSILHIKRYILTQIKPIKINTVKRVKIKW